MEQDKKILIFTVDYESPHPNTLLSGSQTERFVLISNKGAIEYLQILFYGPLR